MKRPQYIQLDIPSPCSQNWDEKVPTGSGRHCMHCSTTVIDFSTWTDADLYQFFAKSREHVCGQFLFSQLGRPIHIPPQPHSRLYRMMVAMGLTLIFTGAYEAQAQKVPLAQQVNIAQKQPIAGDGRTSLKGTITDKKKEPLTNASVSVFENDTLRGGAVADFDGNYSIAPLAPGTYKVVIRYVGYHSLTLEHIVVGTDVYHLNSILEQDGTIVARPPMSYRKGGAMPYRHTTVLTASDIKKVGTDPQAESEQTEQPKKFRWFRKHKRTQH